MERRNTIQKGLVLSAVRSLKDHATAEEVYENIKKEYPNIGKGTVYRNLGILAEEGEIRRISLPGEPDRYDHITENKNKPHHEVRLFLCLFSFSCSMMIFTKKYCYWPRIIFKYSS